MRITAIGDDVRGRRIADRQSRRLGHGQQALLIFGFGSHLLRHDQCMFSIDGSGKNNWSN